MRKKDPPIPPETRSTVRQKIIKALSDGTLTAGEISTRVGVSEKDVCDHLVHIQKTLSRNIDEFHVIPAECKGCGFQFQKRTRLTKPGRCPICRGEFIDEPLFSIKKLSTEDHRR